MPLSAKLQRIAPHWDDTLRLSGSLLQGQVPATGIMRTLSAQLPGGKLDAMINLPLIPDALALGLPLSYKSRIAIAPRDDRPWSPHCATRKNQDTEAGAQLANGSARALLECFEATRCSLRDDSCERACGP
jgi:hypothetical protein